MRIPDSQSNDEDFDFTQDIPSLISLSTLEGYQIICVWFKKDKMRQLMIMRRGEQMSFW